MAKTTLKKEKKEKISPPIPTPTNPTKKATPLYQVFIQ